MECDNCNTKIPRLEKGATWTELIFWKNKQQKCPHCTHVEDLGMDSHKFCNEKCMRQYLADKRKMEERTK